MRRWEGLKLFQYHYKKSQVALATFRGCNFQGETPELLARHTFNLLGKISNWSRAVSGPTSSGPNPAGTQTLPEKPSPTYNSELGDPGPLPQPL